MVESCAKAAEVDGVFYEHRRPINQRPRRTVSGLKPGFGDPFDSQFVDGFVHNGIEITQRERSGLGALITRVFACSLGARLSERINYV